MSRVKRAKVKRAKTALSVFGLAGISLAATAATTSKSVAGVPSPATVPVQAFAIGEEEISDVTLATFHLFEKESVDQSRSLLQLTRCGGCGRCGGGGCRGCGGRGCGGGCKSAAVAAGAAADAEDAGDADSVAVAAAVAAAAWVGVCLGAGAGPGAEPSQRVLRNLFVCGPDSREAIRPLIHFGGRCGTLGPLDGEDAASPFGRRRISGARRQ